MDIFDWKENKDVHICCECDDEYRAASVTPPERVYKTYIFYIYTLVDDKSVLGKNSPIC